MFVSARFLAPQCTSEQTSEHFRGFRAPPTQLPSKLPSTSEASEHHQLNFRANFRALPRLPSTTKSTSEQTSEHFRGFRATPSWLQEFRRAFARSFGQETLSCQRRERISARMVGLLHEIARIIPNLKFRLANLACFGDSAGLWLYCGPLWSLWTSGP